MLDAEVTTKITQNVSLTGAGSPLVFDADGNTETLTKFKVDGQEKTIRSASFNNDGLLQIELASFSPTGVSASGQTNLAWDVAASSFSIAATNPTDFPSEYLANIKNLTAGTGTVELNLANYNRTGTALPLTAVDGAFAGNIASTFTLKSGYYIRPTGATGATGGSASAVVTFLKQDGTTEYSPTYTWNTSWQNVSHNITLAALTGKTFLKKYTSSNYTVSQSGLSNAANVAHTVTAANGTPSNPNGSGTLDFTVGIHKDNTSTATTVTLASVFTRPSAVTGTQYTHAPSNDVSSNVAASASFSYPSIKLTTASNVSSPSLSDIIADGTATGFHSNVQVLSDQTSDYPLTAVTNSSNEPVKFWFGVRTSAQQPTSFKTGDNVAQYAVAPAGLITVTKDLEPTTSLGAGYQAESYTFYGFNIAANATTYVVIS